MTARILLAGVATVATHALAARLRTEYLCVSVCANEAATIERVREWRPDLILLECAPDDQDFAFCRRLRAEPCSRPVPLLLLAAGADDPAVRLRGLELGADDVLGAPIDTRMLLARLHALVRAKRLQDAHASGDAGAPGSAAGGSVAGARVLVIDDDEPAATAAQDALARDGLAVGRAATAGQAADLCAAVGFDLIVLNLGLLTDDPLRVVAGLRAAEDTRQVPLLLLSTPERRSLLLRAFALGGDECLMLPAAAEELRARARNQLRRKFFLDRQRADRGQALETTLTDPLTGCYNRRHLGRQLRALLADGPARGVALLLLDIDDFKAVNDRLGYAAGDAALGAVAAILREAIRGLDSVARSGGEEFVVVMPGCALAEAIAAGERLRCCVEGRAIPVQSGEPCMLTVSIGVVASDGDPTTPERLLHLAARALETARAQGGNRVAGAALAEVG